MLALHRALTLTEVDYIAILVSDNLDLNVLGIFKEFLNKDSRVVESSQCLMSAKLIIGLHLALFVANTHTTTTTTSRRLDNYRVSKLICLLYSCFSSRHTLEIAAKHWNLNTTSYAFGDNLVTHGMNNLRRRADEDYTSISAGLGKIGIFREITITRVHRLDIVIDSDLNQILDIEELGDTRICVREIHNLINLLQIDCIRLLFSADCVGLDSHPSCCTSNTDGNLTTVSNK